MWCLSTFSRSCSIIFSPGNHGFSTLVFRWEPHGFRGVFRPSPRDLWKSESAHKGHFFWSPDFLMLQYLSETMCEHPTFILDGCSLMFTPSLWKSHSFWMDFNLQFFRPKWYRNSPTTIFAELCQFFLARSTVKILSVKIKHGWEIHFFGISVRVCHLKKIRTLAICDHQFG